MAAPEFRAVTVKDTLIFWAMDDGVNSGFALQKITRKFSQQSKVPVKVRFLGWGSAFDELNRVLSMDSADVMNSGAEIPDVIQLGSSWTPYFAKAGVISPVDSLLEMADSTRFLSEAMKATHVGHGKETYSLPWFLDVRGLFVNERLWNQQGFNEDDVESYPKFFGTLRAIAKSGLKNEAGRKVTPFEFGVRDDWTGQQQMAPILWSFGGDIVTESMDSAGHISYRSALTDSLTLVGLRHYLKLLRDEELSPNGLHENSSQSTDRFIRSEMLMIFGTSEIIRKMEFGNDLGGLMESSLAKDGITVVPAPKGPAGRFTFVGGSHLALPKIGAYNETRRKSAVDLFLYMLRADNVDYYSHQIGFLPADRGLIRIWAEDNRYYQLIDGLEKNGRSFLNIPEWGQVEVIINDMVNHIGKTLLDRNLDAAEEIANLVVDAHEKVNAVLGYSDSTNGSELKSRIKLSLMQPVQEQKNEMHEISAEKGTSLFMFVVTGAIVLLLGSAVVILRRKH